MSNGTVLCVCTYRRPEGLRNLLERLRELNEPGELTVVVVDNDSAAEGVHVCENLPEDYPFKVHSQLQNQPGITFSRNAAFTTALSLEPEFIACLDDDEWPSKNWLFELRRIQQRYDADIVGGPTRTVFPENTAKNFLNNPYYGADLELPDGASCKLEAAGNFIIRAETARLLEPNFFHPDFANSCGEDLAFFTQLTEHDVSMHWAANAEVSESVEDYRLSDTWMKSRVITIANSRVRAMKILKPGVINSVVRCVKTGGLFGYSMLLTVLGLVNSTTAQEARILRWKFWGKFTAHLNIATTRQEQV